MFDILPACLIVLPPFMYLRFLFERDEAWAEKNKENLEGEAHVAVGNNYQAFFEKDMDVFLKSYLIFQSK